MLAPSVEEPAAVATDVDPQELRHQRGAQGRRPRRVGRRARRRLRPVGFGQVDAAAHDQPAGASQLGIGVRRRGRVRPGTPRRAGGRRGTAMQLRRQIGMVFQQFNLFPHLDVLDNVAVSLRHVKSMNKRGVWNGAAIELRKVGLLDPPGPSTRTSSRAGSNSERPSPVRWRWTPRCCSSTNRRRPSTPSSSASAGGDEPARRLGMTMVVVTHEMGFALRGRRPQRLHGRRVHRRAGGPGDLHGRRRVERTRLASSRPCCEDRDDPPWRTGSPVICLRLRVGRRLRRP